MNIQKMAIEDIITKRSSVPNLGRYLEASDNEDYKLATPKPQVSGLFKKGRLPLRFEMKMTERNKAYLRDDL